MLVYILKSVACLAILFVFYKVFLEKENMHKIKRFYLLGALVFAMIVPSLVFTEYVVVEPAPIISETTPVLIQETEFTNDVINVSPALDADVFDIEPLLWGIYFIGMLFFGLKFIRNLFQIFRRIQKNPKQKLYRFTQVLLLEKITPHTFFSYIFLNKKKFEADQIPAEVILHEQTHARQKHSCDVILVELLHVFFWVNPFIYLTKNAIKLNHEFLADEAVLKNNIDKTTYQNTLLSYLSPDSEKKYQPLANAINYSSTRLTVFGKTFMFGSAVGQVKKRFTVMKTHTSKKAVLFRSLVLLPILTLMLFGFSETQIVEQESESIKNIKEELKKIDALRLNYVTIEGDWIEKDNESTELSITTNNGEYLFNVKGSYTRKVQEINGEFYYITPQGKRKLQLSIDAKNTILTYGKIEFVPLETSAKGKLYGQWENIEQGIKFNVSHSGNEMVWDIILEGEKPVRYYPKKEGDRYVFSYGKDLSLWSFRVEGNILYDTKGTTYNRIAETQNQFTIAEVIDVHITKTGQILVKNQVVLIDDAFAVFSRFNSDLSKEEKSQVVDATIHVEDGAPQKTIDRIEQILIEYGTATINIAEWNDSKDLERIWITIMNEDELWVNDQQVQLDDLAAKLSSISATRDLKDNLKIQIYSEETLHQNFLNKITKEADKVGVSSIQVYTEEYIMPENDFKEDGIDLKTSKVHLKTNKMSFEKKSSTNDQLLKYNALAKKYNAIPIEKRIIPRQDLKILETVYGKMSSDQKSANQPFPECLAKNKQENPHATEPKSPIQSDSLKFVKDWFITLNGEKYFYLRDKNRVWHYYNESKKEVDLDIVLEYKKKYNKYQSSKNNGTHYIDKSKNEQNLLDIIFSDLGGMYFRMPRIDKNKVKRPASPYAPYIRLIKNGKTLYKKKNELTEGDKKLLPAPPDYITKTTNQNGASKKQITEYNALAKKYNTMLSKSKSIQIKMKDVERLKYIYSLMSAKQIANAESFPEFPEPPPVPKAPKTPKPPKVLKGEASNIPPPPKAPKAPKVLLGELSDIPKPPSPMVGELPAPPNISYQIIDDKPLSKELKNLVANYTEKSKAYRKTAVKYLDSGEGNRRDLDNSYGNLMKVYKLYRKQATKEGLFAHPSPSFYPLKDKSMVPNPPPPPKPLDHIVEMAKKDAQFFFEGKEITSDKAIQLMKENDEINLDSRSSTLKRPIVKLSTKPIKFNK